MTALGHAPAHWRRTTIGDIAEVRLGRQRSPKDHAGEFMQSYLRAANVDWYSLRSADIQKMNFTNDEMDTYALRTDDILIVEGSGSATEVGKCALVPEKYAGHAFQNTLIRVRPNETVDPRWLMYRINAEAELGGFLKLARGSGIFHLGSTRTAAWPIAVPPLEEQHLIIEAIERMQSKRDAAVRMVNASRARLQPFRRSALAQAFRLSRFSVDADRRGWASTTIGDIAEVRLGRQRSPKNHAGEFMQSYLRAANVDWYSLRSADIQKMNFTNDEMDTYALRTDDILIVEGSGSATEVGKCALVPEKYAGHAFQNTLIRVRPNETVDPRWLMYRINAEAELGGFLKLARGSGIFHLGSTRTAAWPIAVPPLEEQQRAVEEIETAFSQLRHLDATVAKIESRTAVLGSSILKSAFEGRLARTNAEAHLPSEQVPA